MPIISSPNSVPQPGPFPPTNFPCSAPSAWIPHLSRLSMLNRNGSGSLLLGFMHALLQMMQLFPQIVPWQTMSNQFLRKIAFFVNGQSKLEQNDSRDLALDMLLALAEHCDHLHEGLRREVPVDSLIRHLDNTDQRVLLSSLALVNALYGLADREERISIVKILHERPFIAAIGRVLARECPPIALSHQPIPLGNAPAAQMVGSPASPQKQHFSSNVGKNPSSSDSQCQHGMGEHHRRACPTRMDCTQIVDCFSEIGQRFLDYIEHQIWSEKWEPEK